MSSRLRTRVGGVADCTLRGTEARRPSEGFTLVEVMVAITMLAIVLVGLAQMTVVLAKRTRDASVAATRAAIATGEMNRLTALPYSQLAGEAGTVTVNEPPLPYKRIITVDESQVPREISIQIVPLNSAYRPQTVVIKRMPERGDPFNTKP